MTRVVSDDINALPVHMNKVIKMAATVSWLLILLKLSVV